MKISIADRKKLVRTLAGFATFIFALLLFISIKSPEFGAYLIALVIVSTLFVAIYSVMYILIDTLFDGRERR